MNIKTDEKFKTAKNTMQTPCVPNMVEFNASACGQASRFAELWIMEYIASFHIRHAFLNHAARNQKIILNWSAQNILFFLRKEENVQSLTPV
jgi:hypothetical protein